jgi:hypothetical protein
MAAPTVPLIISWFLLVAGGLKSVFRAFSSEVDTGSREENASKQEVEPRSDSIGTEKALATHLFMAASGMACDTRHFVGHSLGMVQIGIAETGGFYEVAADHSKERPAASMMPSMTSRNTSGSSRKTNRLAMKARG